MVNLSFYLDVRYVQKTTGAHALKLRIASKGKKLYLPLGSQFVFTPDQWDAASQRVTKKVSGSKMINVELNALIASYRNKVIDAFGMESVDASKVLELLSGKISGKSNAKRNRKSVVVCLEDYIKIKRDKPKSAESYQYTLQKIRQYVNNSDNLLLDDIDILWLRDFEDWMVKGGKDRKALSVNTAAIHLENLRAIYNYAIDEGLTDKYPFRRFKIKRERVTKDILSLQEMRQLWQCEGANEYEEYYLDIFRLSFALCGLNMADLYNLRDEDLKAGRIEFNRQKTGVHGSIMVEPEAMRIINKHKGSNGRLIDLSERYADVDSFISKINKRLKQIGDFHWEGHFKVMDRIYWPHISTYTARYCWATFAGMEDVSYDTIDMGLTHKGNSMTDYYVRPFLKKLDVANRRVLDIVTGISEPTYQM